LDPEPVRKDRREIKDAAGSAGDPINLDPEPTRIEDQASAATDSDDDSDDDLFFKE
jgi:hypothetical protein